MNNRVTCKRDLPPATVEETTGQRKAALIRGINAALNALKSVSTQILRFVAGKPEQVAIPALVLLVAGPMLILAAFGDFYITFPRRRRFRIPQGFHRPHIYFMESSGYSTIQGALQDGAEGHIDIRTDVKSSRMDK